MLKNILNLDGIQSLSKNELLAVNGGDYTIGCTFPDGLGYELTYAYGSEGNAVDALLYCLDNGGEYTLVITSAPD
ncbi:hypothetical protein [Dokdonia sp.]|uniref:hypothetical protein n=1 Tax=Dokdonia sp. TaxID=2024995 RepID=UPI0032662235